MNKVRFAVPSAAVMALPWAAAGKRFAMRYMVFAMSTRHTANYPILLVYTISQTN
jgi:hypothetical protein